MRKSVERPPKALKNGADMHSRDPLGNYTGVPEGEHERPVQDADDL